MDNLISHLVDTGNALLERSWENEDIRPVAKAYYRSLLRGCADRPSPTSDSANFWRSIQLVGQQGFNIFSWREQGFPGAGDVRLTVDPGAMLGADGRGPSFLDKKSFLGQPAIGEGQPGPYWRGVEGVAKVKGSLVSDWRDDPDGIYDWVVLYTMVHGIVPVPQGLRGWTESGRVSTFHDTAFLWDFVPGTRQAASTGGGHFQGLQLDLKQVVEGQGIQFNVMYGSEGEVRRVYGQELKPPCLAVALPGHVDYVVNTGGLRFHDISFRLDADSSRLFGPGVNPSVISRAPYAVSVKGTVLPAFPEVPALIWLNGAGSVFGHPSPGWLYNTYRNLTENFADALIRKLCSNVNALLEPTLPDVPR
jgi:hypothetical protein